jgi:hypothetical protein
VSSFDATTNRLLIKKAVISTTFDPMKNSILFKIKSFRSKSVRIEKLFPLPLLRGALGITLRKAFALSVDNNESVLARLKISKSFLALLLKMHRHHGPTYTVK